MFWCIFDLSKNPENVLVMEANNELKLIAEKIICHLEVNALMNFEERTVSQRMIGMKKFIHGTYVKPQSAQAALALHYMMSAPKFDQL